MAEIDAGGLLEAFIDAQILRAGNAMREALIETEFAESQEEVPVDVSNLKDSGVVSEVVMQDGDAYVAIGYGAGETARNLAIYAIVQHERSDYDHPNGGKWKYLEDPVTRNQGTLAKRTAEKM